MRHVTLVCALVVSVAAVAQATQQQAGATSSEYAAKAAFLYQFSRFIEWPPAAATGPHRICIAEQDVFQGVLEDTVRGQFVNGRPLEIHVIPGPSADCHVLFIPARVATAAYIGAPGDAATLTVGESAAFLQDGGIIRLFLEDEAVRFEIDLGAAERAGLRVSARLLQLARAVRNGGGA